MKDSELKVVPSAELPLRQGTSLEQAQEEFYFTTHHLHRWSSGPTFHTLNSEAGYEPFTSLEQVRIQAEAATVISSRDDHCVTTYGVRYIFTT